MAAEAKPHASRVLLDLASVVEQSICSKGVQFLSDLCAKSDSIRETGFVLDANSLAAVHAADHAHQDEPVALDTRPAADRREATSSQLSQHRAFGVNGCVRFMMV
jgi:hypothetical protein